MIIFSKILIATCLASLASQLVAQTAKSDESKPYEFGFTIDGQQHRHEKKDENGIIQGEFGFITADGIYHVTVYATDENGNFKILSMRNVRISAPLDGSPGPGPDSDAKSVQGQQPKPQPAPLQLPEPTTTTTKAPFTSAPKKPLDFTTLPTIKPACAGCGYVTTPKPIPGQPFPFQTPAFQNNGGVQSTGGVQNNNGVPQNNGGQITYTLQQNEKEQTTYTQQNNFTQQTTFTQENNDQVYNQQQGAVPGPQPNPLAIPEQPQGVQQYDNNQYTQVNQQQNTVVQSQQPVSTLPPISVTNNEIHVQGSHPQTIPIKDKFPGMSDGLPDGIEEKDITDLLYKFHYTVGFHGHWEKGTKSGAKIGGYFVNGRDGVSRVVTYIADENGYRPKFKFVRLGLDSDETPKEATEKTFGLKSFEFVWYPIEA